VVLESIHPPFEIAEVFQNLVGAEITATKYLHEAHGLAEVTLADANRRYDASVNLALSDQYDKIAKAKADVAVFMASVEADMDNSTAYRYYKYLNALKTAYGQSTLVIIGNGIDESNIYFGTIWSDK
jgi:regulator of protease activity HflC (stomatin/prohibitin superfamily)